jgi:hypothetical protein
VEARFGVKRLAVTLVEAGGGGGLETMYFAGGGGSESI